MDEEIRELLAAYAHEAWSGYMGYFLGRCITQPDGALLIPAGYVRGLEELIAMPYARLSEIDKASDREEADKMLAIIGLVGGER